MPRTTLVSATLAAALATSVAAQTAPKPGQAAARAEATLRSMRPAEKTVLTHGIMPLPVGDNPPPIPSEAIPGAGYVPGIARLGVPSLRETDASLGVSYVFGRARTERPRCHRALPWPRLGTTG